MIPPNADERDTLVIVRPNEVSVVRYATDSEGREFQEGTTISHGAASGWNLLYTEYGICWVTRVSRTDGSFEVDLINARNEPMWDVRGTHILEGETWVFNVPASFVTGKEQST